ncbi:hypothetical protein WJX73_007016 [Symbiochloris irregularis]|uniref:Alliinase C-terminal domain-containing protein n=1 Tax=Symbiochloris irregularis TaxID=706552 RepID=A0AAW1NMQ7_9CHLO
MIDSESGTPYLYERYWLQHPEAEFRLLPSDNIGYLDFPGPVLPRLEAAIIRLHAQVGNAITEGRRIVVGVGSAEVLMASMWVQAGAAMKSSTSNGPVQVYSQPPYYSAYPEVATALGSRDFTWTNMSSNDLSSAQQDVVEFACSPNNPDGALQNQTIAGSRVIHDHAYYWPHYTPIMHPVDYGPQDIAVFTLSKLTGHASSRIGWAVVGDPALADGMQQYVNWHGNIPLESQARAATLLEHVIGSQGGIFSYGRVEMQRRWTLLSDLAAGQQRFTFQSRQAAFDHWSGRTEMATPPYLWIRCNQERDADCAMTLQQAGITPRDGQKFGASAQYARLSLLMRQMDFDKMALKLERLMMG